MYACNGKQSDRKVVEDPSKLDGATAYANATDGKVYGAEWKKYTPEQGMDKPGGPNSLKQIVLLTEQAKVQQRIELDTLASYMRNSENLVLDELTGSKDTGEILVQFTLLPRRQPDIMLSYKGKLDDDALNRLRLKLNASSRWFRTIKDSCAYQLHFLVNTRDGQ
jgi:hypothetical protein